MAGIDSNALLVLHFDGADGSTTVTDSSLSPHVMTAVGDAQIDTAESKFGGGSGLFDGTGDYISAPDSPDWSILPNTTTDSFTIDFWVRFASLATNAGIMGQYTDSSNFWDIFVEPGFITISAQDSGANGFQLQGTWSPSLNTWYHVAIVHDAPADNLMFIDGSTISVGAIVNKNIPDLAAELRIGNHQRFGYFMNGWLEEFRISNIARWTSGFTPPTLAYSPPSIGDFAKNLPLLSVQAEGAPGAAFTLPSLSVAIQGGPGASLTLPILTVSATTPFANASVSLPGLSVFAGPARGSDLTLPSPTVSAGQFVRGNISITLPRPTFITVVQQGTVENIDMTFPVLTLNASVGKKVELTLPQLSFAIEGKNGLLGTFSKSLPRVTVNVKASQNIIGTFGIPLPSPTFSTNLLTGTVSLSGGNRTLPIFSLNAHAYRGENGDVATTLPVLSLTTEVALNPSGTVSQSLFMLTLDAYADIHINRII
jgi:hypothetical protein